MGIKFFNDMKALGLGYALDCAKADIQFNTSKVIYNLDFKERQKQREEETYPEFEESINTNPLMSSTEFDNLVNALKNQFAELNKTKEDSKTALAIATKSDNETDNSSGVINLIGFSDDDIANNLDNAYAELSDCNQMHVRLTILAMLYLGCFITVESMYKNIVADNSEEELDYLNSFINTITGIPLLTEKAQNITDLIDIKDLKKIVNFEAAYDKVQGSVEIEGVVSCIENLSGVKNVNGENVIISPLSFATNPVPETMIQNGTIKKSEITMLEKKFEGLLDGYNHQFNKMTDLYELAILRPNGYVESYTIDPGHVFGIGTALIIDRFGSKFPLSVKMKDTCKKILANSLSANNLTQKEMIEMTKDLMVDYHIYANIDMSRGEEIRSKMSKDEFKKFENILGTILKLPWGKDGRPMLPRTRIRSFKAWNDFILVSDEKVKCPLFAWSNMLISDMTIIVKKDKILIRYGDNEGVVDLTKVA